MNLQTKRWIVYGASLAAGVVLTWIIIYTSIPIVPHIEIQAIKLDFGPVYSGFGTNMAHFAYSNVVLLFISIASIAGIWLDYLLDAKILKN